MEFYRSGITRLTLLIPYLACCRFLNTALRIPETGITGRRKTGLMTHRKLLNRVIILVFMVLVGFCLANSIDAQSVIGFILALIGLSAGIYFLHVLAKANEELKREQEETA